MKRKLQLRRILLICTMLIAMINLQAQNQTVSGTVTSAEEGVPLSGVSVMALGASSGTTTDNTGKYSLHVPNGKAKIVFSYTGFVDQTISVNNRSVIHTVLTRDTKQLSEVVVTALGITKEKKAVGFSTQELSKKDLTEARDVNVANYLTGKIAGVQVSLSAGGVGGSSKVIIRGISSLVGENQPLYVVDGVPIDNTKYKEATDIYGNGRDYGDGIGNINPQDIESINVLKGPNATALWGSRGSNGVILITTKSGKAGKGVAVEVNSNVTIDKINLLPKLQNKYGTGYEDQNLYGDIVNIGGVDYSTLPSWHFESDGPPMDGRLLVDPFVFPGTAPRTFKFLPQPENNVRDFYQTGVVTNNSVALSGGSEKASARLSVNNTTINGIIPNHKENQQSITLRA
ncbi:MAG: TonB-dependent receptor plug domain-containing protein, partial [Ginsengibacter sp.]